MMVGTNQDKIAFERFGPLFAANTQDFQRHVAMARLGFERRSLGIAKRDQREVVAERGIDRRAVSKLEMRQPRAGAVMGDITVERIGRRRRIVRANDRRILVALAVLDADRVVLFLVVLD